MRSGSGPGALLSSPNGSGRVARSLAFLALLRELRCNSVAMLVAAAGNIVSRRPWYLGTAVISTPSQQEQCGGWGRCRRRGGKSQISHVVAKKSTDAAVLEEEDDDYQEELPDIQKVRKNVRVFFFLFRVSMLRVLDAEEEHNVAGILDRGFLV